MNVAPYSLAQLTLLLILRLLVGWHLLYEGIIKVWSPGAGSLQLLDHNSLLLLAISRLDLNSGWVDLLNAINVWVLVFAGLGLILGLFGRAAALGAGVLLLGCRLAHVPLLWPPQVQLLADPYLVEAVVLGLLFVFPTSHYLGIDRVRVRHRTVMAVAPAEAR